MNEDRFLIHRQEESILLDSTSPQTDLQIQSNSYQNPSWLFCKNWQADTNGNAKDLELSKQFSKSELWNGLNHPVQNLIQSQRNPDSVMLAQGQTRGSKEQKRVQEYTLKIYLIPSNIISELFEYWIWNYFIYRKLSYAQIFGECLTTENKAHLNLVNFNN